MKTILAFALVLLVSLTSIAQNGINYKALIKDANGNVIASSSIDIQFIIYEGAALTNNVYQESHTINTDANGFVIVTIGEGTTSDDFSVINWSSDEHYLNVQINIGSGLVDLSTTQFMAVPYALSSGDHPWTKNENGVHLLNSDVGINRENPEHTLDVRSMSQADAAGINLSNNDKTRNLRFFSGSETFPDPSITRAPGHDLLFATFNDNTFVFDEQMRISSQGNLGIGTDSPNQKLEVNGKIKVGDDNQSTSGGTMRFNTSTFDFEGHNGFEYKSFTNKDLNYFYEKENQVSTNIRNTFIPIGDEVEITENGTYLIFYSCSITNLIGNITTAPSDNRITLVIQRTFSSSSSYIDTASRTPLEEFGTSAVHTRWRDSEHLTDFSVFNLNPNDRLRLLVQVEDNGIGNLTTNYFINETEFVVVKLSE